MLNSETIITALKQHEIHAKFVFVLEMIGKDNPPRWSTGGNKCKQFPTSLPISELKEISIFKHRDVDVPEGWSKLNHFIYLLGKDTDDQGWSYRSEWSEGNPKSHEEQWRNHSKDTNDVRRRVWFCVAVRKKDTSKAKSVVSAFLIQQLEEDKWMMKDDVQSRESGFLFGNIWASRYIILTETKLEIFTNAAAAQAAAAQLATRRADIHLVSSSSKSSQQIQLQYVHFERMYGAQFGLSSDYIAVLRDVRAGNVVCVLDFNNEVKWKRWSQGIVYQIALNTPLLNYFPFDNGPPCDDLSAARVVVYGHLHKKGHIVANWKKVRIIA